jgi:hypothetical protein
METLIEDPGQVPGRAYLHSATIAAYINEQAHPNGHLPEFQNGKITVHPDEIEYEVPPLSSPASKLAVNFDSFFELRGGPRISAERGTLRIHTHLTNQTEEIVSTTVTVEATVSEDVVATKTEQVSVPVDRPEQVYLDMFQVDELSDSKIESMIDGHWQLRHDIGDYTVKTGQIDF